MEDVPPDLVIDRKSRAHYLAVGAPATVALGMLFAGYLAFAGMVNPYQPASRQRVQFLEKVLVREPYTTVLFTLLMTGPLYWVVTAVMRVERRLRNLAAAALLAWVLVGVIVLWRLVWFAERVN